MYNNYCHTRACTHAHTRARTQTLQVRVRCPDSSSPFDLYTVSMYACEFVCCFLYAGFVDFLIFVLEQMFCFFFPFFPFFGLFVSLLVYLSVAYLSYYIEQKNGTAEENDCYGRRKMIDQMILHKYE